MRYSIHAIRTADCNSYEPEILAEHDDFFGALGLASDVADKCAYGACIHDSETGLVDYGHGFGVDVVLDGERPDEITEKIPNMDALVRELHERGHSQ